jgi:ribose transport system ATP-binding protein
MTTTSAPLLRMRGITKRFGGVTACDGVDLDLDPGEALGLVGENGAGKSTLMKILGGVVDPDAGEIRLEGRPVAIHGVRQAERLGIALIHQELNLVPDIDVAGNLLLGREPRWGGRLALIDRPRLDAAAREVLSRVGLDVDPRAPLGGLSPGQQQLVEIGKALSRNARILVMDEPTSSLARREVETLFGIIRQLKAQGLSVVYISHRLDEVLAVTDRILTMRDGRRVGEIPTPEATVEKVIQMIVGRAITDLFPREHARLGEEILSVEGLAFAAARAPISFTLRRGEILGFAGLVGARRTETMRALFGADPATAGRIRVAGREVAIRSPRDAIAAGLGFVPEERKLQGLILEMAIDANISLPGLHRVSRAGLLNRRWEADTSARYATRLAIKTPTLRREAQTLSGGNQQKTVLAKWLSLEPRVLILDEPTRGVDVGAKAEIYALIGELARSGVGILLVSSELEEILGLCDRAAVLCNGRLVGCVEREAMTEQRIMAMAMAFAEAS